MAPASLRDLENEPAFAKPPRVITGRTKPKLYLLDNFHPAAVQHAHELFDCVLQTDFEQSWRNNVKYLLIRSSYFNETDVNSCPKLLAIGKQGVGIDRIDSVACAKRNVPILNTPGVNAWAVAELVLSLAMSVSRQISNIHGRQSRGERIYKEKCSGLLMHRKTIAIIGMGNIGKIVAQIFRGAFESEIIAYDPFMSDDAWADLPHTRVKAVEELLPRADVLTLHVPLTDSTRNLIGYQQLSKMKKTAILINAARGGIVNEEDLDRGLKDGLIWGAGLDCHEQEPPSLGRYESLWENTNVVSTPHIGAATSQTQIETAISAIDRIYDFARAQGDVL